MNIVLIGYRGTGKTTIGKFLSDKLQLPLINTDELIIKKIGLAIPQIVEKFGWNKFRDLEEEVIRGMSKVDKCVIDTGGGVILREENVNNLKKNGKLILLTADISTIISRIKDNKERPSLISNKSFIEEVEEVLVQRKEKYEKSADFTIETTGFIPEEIVEKICNYLTLL